MKQLKITLRSLIYYLKFICRTKHCRISFSQDSEDILLMCHFDRKKKEGFYVDVGALDPVRFSNTYLFYRKGWRGIVVEPNPKAEKLFRKTRKRDIFIGEGVARQKGELTYHCFKEPALNTFDPKIAAQRELEGRLILKCIPRRISPLSEILDQNMPKSIEIDFMSIDAEGMDDEIIRSNNWEKYRPLFLIAEIDSTINDFNQNSTIQFLLSKGYKPLIKSNLSIILKRID